MRSVHSRPSLNFYSELFHIKKTGSLLLSERLGYWKIKTHGVGWVQKATLKRLKFFFLQLQKFSRYEHNIHKITYLQLEQSIGLQIVFCIWTIYRPISFVLLIRPWIRVSGLRICLSQRRSLGGQQILLQNLFYRSLLQILTNIFFPSVQ